jgi:hypothetical protein
MRFDSLRGMGDDTVVNADGSVSTVLPTLTTVNLPGSAFIDPTTGNYVDYSNPLTPVGGTPSIYSNPTGNASTGFNWGSFLTNIAADATKLGQQAIATPGTLIGPSGQVAVGGVNPGAIGISSATLSGLMPVLLIGGGLLLVLMMAKGRR